MTFVNAQVCVTVPRCDGNNDTTITRCFTLDKEVDVDFHSSILGNVFNRNEYLRVDPDGNVIQSYDIPVPEVTGFRFDGWYYNGDRISDVHQISARFIPRYVQGTVCEYDDEGMVIRERNVSISARYEFERVQLIAEWIPIPVTVNYVLPDNTSRISEYIGGELTTNIFDNVGDGDNYTWYYDSEFTRPVEANVIGELNFEPIYGDDYYGFGPIATDYRPLTIYAKDSFSCIGDNEFNLLYNTNGGTELKAEVVNVSSSDYLEEKLPTPTKTGYKFEGWYYDSEFKNKVETEFKVRVKPGTELDADGCPMFKDITIYANWVADASQFPDGDDSYNGALDPSEGENASSGLENDDVPDTGAEVSLIILISIATITSLVYLYVLKNNKIKRLV